MFVRFFYKCTNTVNTTNSIIMHWADWAHIITFCINHFAAVIHKYVLKHFNLQALGVILSFVLVWYVCISFNLVIFTVHEIKWKENPPHSRDNFIACIYTVYSKVPIILTWIPSKWNLNWIYFTEIHIHTHNMCFDLGGNCKLHLVTCDNHYPNTSTAVYCIELGLHFQMSLASSIFYE